jgi:hypothetical protein
MAPINIFHRASEVYVIHLGEISAGAVIVSFFAVWIRRLLKGEAAQDMELQPLLSAAIATAAFPMGIALIICVFDTALLTNLTGFQTPIGIAGVVFLFFSVTALAKEWNRDCEAESESENE